MSAVQPELASRLLEVARAIDGVLLADPTLRHALKPGHVPFNAPIAEGVARYGEGPVFGLWLMCRQVEALRIAWTGKPGVTIEAAPGEPDEAPGLDVPTETAEPGADRQERLAG
jgi:hypothetical protein